MTQFFAQNSEIIIRLLIAGGLGLLIGGERLFVHKEAGMKTHALVSMGSALFVIISEMIAIKYSGIGGLGAGSIMLQGSRLKGLTTASGLWVTAGIGMAAGFGFFSLAVITMVLVLFVFVVVNKFEKPIRKISENSEEQDFN